VTASSLLIHTGLLGLGVFGGVGQVIAVVGRQLLHQVSCSARRMARHGMGHHFWLCPVVDAVWQELQGEITVAG